MCLFCRMLAGEVPMDVVRETGQSVAIRDIDPKAPTHVLVIPRRHIASADDLTEHDGEVLAAMFAAVRRVARDGGLRSYRIVSNVGAESGQSVFHLHLHLLGGRSMGWPPG